MTAPKTTRKPTAKAATTTRKAAAAAPKQPTVEPVDTRVADLAKRAPSPVNRAEAEWLVLHAGLDVRDAKEMELLTKAVQLVAGSAHRLFQASPQAASAHAAVRNGR